MKDDSNNEGEFCSCLMPLGSKTCHHCKKPVKGTSDKELSTQSSATLRAAQGDGQGLSLLQLAYNEGIEAAKAAIRHVAPESDDAPIFINAVARLCNPYGYRPMLYQALQETLAEAEISQLLHLQNSFDLSESQTVDDAYREGLMPPAFQRARAALAAVADKEK